MDVCETVNKLLNITDRWIQSTRSSIDNDLRLHEWYSSSGINNFPVEQIIFPSTRSLLYGIARAATINYFTFIEYLRDVRLVIPLLRLHGFNEKHLDNDDRQQRDKFVNFDIFSLTINNNGGAKDVSPRTVLMVEEYMRDLRYTVSALEQRCSTLEEKSMTVENEIAVLRNEYDNLLSRANERYGGSWTQWSSDNVGGSGEMISEERDRLTKQIEKLSEAAEKMTLFLTQSNDSVKLALQYKMTEIEKSLTSKEDEANEKHNNQLRELFASINSIERVRLPLAVRLREVTSQIQSIVTSVRTVISGLTVRLIDLLDDRRRQREELEKKLREQAGSPAIDRSMKYRAREIMYDRTNVSFVNYDNRQLKEYANSVTYPTIVDSGDLRTIHADICDAFARKSLKIFLTYKRPPYFMSPTYRITRNALVAFLYFYGTSDRTLDFVQLRYQKMKEGGEVVVSTDGDDRDISYRAFFDELHIDLSLIPIAVFDEILHLFRLRCRRYQKGK